MTGDNWQSQTALPMWNILAFNAAAAQGYDARQNFKFQFSEKIWEQTPEDFG